MLAAPTSWVGNQQRQVRARGCSRAARTAGSRAARRATCRSSRRCPLGPCSRLHRRRSLQRRHTWLVPRRVFDRLQLQVWSTWRSDLLPKSSHVLTSALTAPVQSVRGTETTESTYPSSTGNTVERRQLFVNLFFIAPRSDSGRRSAWLGQNDAKRPFERTFCCGEKNVQIIGAKI